MLDVSTVSAFKTTFGFMFSKEEFCTFYSCTFLAAFIHIDYLTHQQQHFPHILRHGQTVATQAQDSCEIYTEISLLNKNTSTPCRQRFRKSLTIFYCCTNIHEPSLLVVMWNFTSLTDHSLGSLFPHNFTTSAMDQGLNHMEKCGT